MKIDFKRLDDLNARMTIVVEFSDYGPKLDENIKKYSKKLAIKGFRSGKTPKSVLTKMYGKGMLEETVNGILNDQLFGYLDAEKIGYFGSPMMADDAEPIDFNTKTQQDYTFVFDLGLKPVFDLQYNLEQTLQIDVPSIDQAALDEDIIRYRRAFGEDVEVADAPVEDHDRVEILIQLISNGGSPDDTRYDATIDLGRTSGEALKALPGLKAGAVLDVDLEKFTGENREGVLKNILKTETDPLPDAPLMAKVTLTSVRRPQRVALTGEQLTRFTGKEMQDESEFRTFLEKREMDSIQNQTADMKKMAVRKALIQANPFNIPEAFLLKWVNQQRDKKIEEGSMEARHLYRDARWSLLLNLISTKENLEVTEQDIRRQVTNWIIQNVNYMQTDIRKLMDQLYANEYFMSTMKENALEDVVFGNLLPRYQYAEKEVTMDQFEKSFHDLHHELFDHGDHDHDHDHHHGHQHSHSHHEHSHG